MINFTNKQIAAIAKNSKRYCHNGHGMAVFADGDCMQAISSNDVTARSNWDGKWDYRIAYISHPVTQDQVRDILQNN